MSRLLREKGEREVSITLSALPSTCVIMRVSTTFLPLVVLVPASESNAILLSEGKCSITVFACNPCVEDIQTVVWL